MTIGTHCWKRIGVLQVFLCLFILNVGGCKKEMETTETNVPKITIEQVRFTDTGDILLTESEVKSFIKAVPEFREILKKEGQEFKGRQVFSTAVIQNKSPGSVKEINNVLKSYGFNLEGLVSTYGKITGTYNHMMKLQSNKSYRTDIRRMKDLLEKPYIPEEQKEQMKELIKEMEEEDKTEEARAYRRNTTVVLKYKAEIEAVLK